MSTPAYAWGQIVKSSALAHEPGKPFQELAVRQRGIVAHQRGLTLWVLREFQRTVQTYHADFWEAS